MILLMLRGFVNGNFECEFYAFNRANEEHLRKMQLYALWQESNLRPCDTDAALQPTEQQRPVVEL